MSDGFLIRTLTLEEGAYAVPTDWTEQVQAVASEHSTRTVLDGASETSREPGPAAIEVFVADGATVRLHLPWLDELYRTTFVRLASEVANVQMVASEDLRNGVNINSIRGRGGRYERHVDSNPLTGILFVTEHSVDDGGVLEFDVAGSEHVVEPRAGLLALFDARDVPHTVTPLRQDTTRISIPMNFFIHGERQERPSDLDDYLYGSRPA